MTVRRRRMRMEDGSIPSSLHRPVLTMMPHNANWGRLKGIQMTDCELRVARSHCYVRDGAVNQIRATDATGGSHSGAPLSFFTTCYKLQSDDEKIPCDAFHVGIVEIKGFLSPSRASKAGDRRRRSRA